MPIPKTEKVIYDRNPLHKVICQARFPAILKIETEIPSAFQEKLNPQYVYAIEGQEVTIDIKLGNKQGVPDDDFRNILQTTNKNYEFSSEDNKWKVNLTRNFLSLSTDNYIRWSEFKTKFEFALNAFVDVYKPVIFTRIGLRYIDIIVRSKLGIEEVDWVELINPNILGILASPELKESVKDSQTKFVVELEDNESVAKVNIGTVKSADNPEETCFMIDSDFYKLKNMKIDEIIANLDFFNPKAFGLFKWCITEKLHEAMGPSKIQ